MSHPVRTGGRIAKRHRLVCSSDDNPSKRHRSVRSAANPAPNDMCDALHRAENEGWPATSMRSAANSACADPARAGRLPD